MKWFRINEWWNSKIVALMGLVYLLVLDTNLSSSDLISNFAFLMIWMILAASFGYYMNDVFDLKQDLQAAKTNHSAKHSWLVKTGISLILIIGILVNWYFLNANSLVLYLIIAQIVAFSLYSFPIIRLKEKPIIGVLTDAIYAHLIPGLVVLLVIYPEIGMQKIALVVFILWVLMTGIRNILSHHLVDFENDTLSNTSTSVTQYGKLRIRRLMNHVISPIEILLFIAMLGFFDSTAFIIIPLYIFYLIYIYFREVLFLKIVKYDWSIKEQENYNFLGGVALNEFYEKWLPVVCLFILSFTNYWMLVLLFIHVAVFFRSVTDFKKDYKILKNIILTKLYWKLVHLFYYKLFCGIKHFIYWKILFKSWTIVRYKLYARFKHYIYWNIYIPLKGDHGNSE